MNSSGASVAVGDNRKPPAKLLRPPRLKTTVIERVTCKKAIVAAALEKRLTLICAPSGYGKTTMMAGVFRELEQQHQTLIWISGNIVDADPSRMERLLCEQLTMRLGIENKPDYQFSELLAQVALEEPVIVMIDNWDYVESLDADQFLSGLVDACDEMARFVLCSRKVPEIPIEAWRLAGDVAEFKMKDLRFDLDQIWQALELEGAPAEKRAKLAELAERTEGWPAGVQLLRLVLPKTSNDPGLEFSGSRQEVSNYLHETLFSGFDEETREFLCHIAYLEELSPELVEAVLPGQNSAEKLANIRRQNLFLNEVSEDSSTLRFHSLFRDFLLVQAQKFATGTEPEICDRASRFFQARGNEVPTIWYAVRGSDQAHALELIETYAEAHLVAQGRIRLFTEWVKVLIKAGADLSPSVSYWYRWCLVFTGRWEAAADLTHADGEQRGAIIDAVIGAFSDDQIRMRNAVNRWSQAGKGADPFSHTVMYSAAAIHHMAAGNFRSAKIEVSKAELAVRQTQGGFGRTWVNVVVAMIETGAGRINEAIAAAERAVAEANKSLLPKAPAARVARLASAVARYWNGNDEGAIEELGYANTERDDHALPVLTVTASAIARHLSVHWETRQFEEFPPSVAIDLVAEAISLDRQMLNQGDVQRFIAAIEALETRAIAALTISSSHSEYTWGLHDLLDILRVKRALAAGELDAAAAIISPAINRCQTSGRGLSEMRLSLLRSVVLYRQEKHATALRGLLQQAEKAVADGLFRPFVEMRHLLHPMLPDLVKAGDRSALGDNRQSWEHLCELLGTSAPEPRVEAAVKPISGLDTGLQVTAREAEILGFLDLGLTNAEIGQRMGISLPTVKWHLANLYSKLNVNNRASAVRFARDHGFA